MTDQSASQFGDVNQRDSAGGNIYNITASLDALVEMLQANLERTDERVTRLEELHGMHVQERQALTRALMLLANESASVKAVQRQLEEQIEAERVDRNHRRRYLDRILHILIATNAATVLLRLAQTALHVRPAGARSDIPATSQEKPLCP